MKKLNENVDHRLSPSWLPQMSAPLEYVQERLSADGVDYKIVKLDPKEIKPLQKMVDTRKVDKFMEAIDKQEQLGPIYVSADNEALDGHHRAFSYIKHPKVTQVACVKIYANYMDAARILNRIQDRFDFENEGSDVNPKDTPFSTPFSSDGNSEPTGDENDQELPVIDTEKESETAAPAVPPIWPPMESSEMADDNGGNSTMIPFDPIAQSRGDDYDNKDAQDPAKEKDLDEMQIVGSNVPEGSEPETSGEEDVALPSVSSKSTYASFDDAHKNAQTLKLYKSKPINTQAKTGDFLLLELKPDFKFEYEIEFENILEFTDEEVETVQFPTELPLKKWMEGVDLQAEAKKVGLPYETFLSRQVNTLAPKNDVDGVKYGNKFVQIVNANVL